MKKVLTIKLLAILLSLAPILSYSQTPIKRVLAEEYTGAWCSSCGFGSYYFEEMKVSHPNAIPVAIHSGDIMEVLTIKNYVSNYFTNLPRFIFDRVDFPDNPQTLPNISGYPWATSLDTLGFYLDKIYNDTPLATVGIDQSYNDTTREISITVTANFVTNTNGNYRLNCYILEDSVTGGSDYDQNNTNFSGWTGAPSFMTPLVNASSTIQGFVHSHVVRDMLGTPEGVDAQIPNSVSDGDSYSKMFTYTIPNGFDAKQISLIGVIHNYGPNMFPDRTIVNAKSEHLQLTDVISEPSSIFTNSDKSNNLSVYPNPSNGNFTIDFYNPSTGNVNGTLYTMQGEKVNNIFNNNLVQGEHRVDLNNLNLQKGIYILKLTTNQYSLNKVITIH